MRAVRFARPHAIYNGGEVASFRAARAEELIAAGVASAWQPEESSAETSAPAGDPADAGTEGSDPAAAGGDPATA